MIDVEHVVNTYQDVVVPLSYLEEKIGERMVYKKAAEDLAKENAELKKAVESARRELAEYKSLYDYVTGQLAAKDGGRNG